MVNIFDCKTFFSKFAIHKLHVSIAVCEALSHVFHVFDAAKLYDKMQKVKWKQSFFCGRGCVWLMASPP